MYFGCYLYGDHNVEVWQARRICCEEIMEFWGTHLFDISKEFMFRWVLWWNKCILLSPLRCLRWRTLVRQNKLLRSLCEGGFTNTFVFRSSFRISWSYEICLFAAFKICFCGMIWHDWNLVREWKGVCRLKCFEDFSRPYGNTVMGRNF